MLIYGQPMDNLWIGLVKLYVYGFEAMGNLYEMISH